MSLFSNMTLETTEFLVIGAGLPRTGTSSLKIALETLLDGKCYHMTRFFESIGSGENHSSFWTKALNSDVREEEWQRFFQDKGFSASVDYPPSLFYKDMMKAFPKAKVILSVRDPETWFRSVQGTIYKSRMERKSWLTRIYLWLTEDEETQSVQQVCNTLCGAVAPGCTLGMLDAVGQGQEAAVAFYLKWEQEVVQSVPAEKLLIFQAKDGWTPLCQFLNKPIPSVPYPKANDTEAFQRMLSKRKMKSIMVVIGLPLGLATLTWFVMTKCR